MKFLLVCIIGFWQIFQLPITNAATDYNRYLFQIFQKYGNGGTMTFEGLEHLMYNLGLGQIEFEPEHTIEIHRPNGYETKYKEEKQEYRKYLEKQSNILGNEDNDLQISITNKTGRSSNNSSPEESQAERETENQLEFIELHDPKHRHPRDNVNNFKTHQIVPNICLSPNTLLSLVVNHEDLHKRKLYKTGKIDANLEEHDYEEEFNYLINNVRITPHAFMKICPALLYQIDENVCVRSAPNNNDDDDKQLLWNAWIYSSATIFILSACGLLGILLVPIMKTFVYQEILKFLIAIAVGTLSGDAFMHLLPHALLEKSHEDSSPNESKEHGHDKNAIYVYGCAFAVAIFMYILENIIPIIKGENHSHNHGHSHTFIHKHDHENTNEEHNIVTKQAAEINIMLDEKNDDKKITEKPLTPLAMMVIIGDALHNLTDGLAIGAAFASDPITGMATAIAVLCHELPHELGDFALLLQTGVSLKRTIYLNLISSILSFVGMAIGLFVTSLDSNMAQWIYAGTAGSFLYIAFADLMPAMNSHNHNNIKNVLLQISGIIVGGLIMLIIALYEDDLVLLLR